jgi:hypothetical protein
MKPRREKEEIERIAHQMNREMKRRLASGSRNPTAQFPWLKEKSIAILSRVKNIMMHWDGKIKSSKCVIFK